jgi:hypothetical protein
VYGQINSSVRDPFCSGCIPSFPACVNFILVYKYVNLKLFSPCGANGDCYYGAYLDRYFSVSTVTSADKFLFLFGLQPSGDLGVLEVNHEGIAEYSGTKEKLQVRDLIGRALVVYSGISAAVIARSAGVGENYKKLCLCDGTVIWESTNNDFVKA